MPDPREGDTVAATVTSDAPVVERGSVRIAADASIVWNLISDIDGWPRWNPDVSSASLAGPLRPGSTFRWKAGPGTITSTLLEVDAPRRIAWRGTTLGIRAVHIWAISPTDDGTLLETEESWEGLLVSVFRRSMRKSLGGAIARGLEAVRVAAETRAGDSSEG